MVIAESDPQFKAILKSADMVTPDSAGVVWACRRKGQQLEGRVSGVDIVARMCHLSADKGYRIYLLGSAQGVAELAAEKLRLRYPGCNIVGTHHGYFPADSDEVVADTLPGEPAVVVQVPVRSLRRQHGTLVLASASRETLRP